MSDSRRLFIGATVTVAVLFCTPLHAGERRARTDSGEEIIVSDDGTWKPVDKSATKSGSDRQDLELTLVRTKQSGSHCYVWARMTNKTSYNFESLWPQVAFFDREQVQIATTEFQFKAIAPSRTVEKETLFEAQCHSLSAAAITKVQTCTLFSEAHRDDAKCAKLIAFREGKQGVLSLKNEIPTSP